jgi:hypothetical protein
MGLGVRYFLKNQMLRIKKRNAKLDSLISTRGHWMA